MSQPLKSDTVTLIDGRVDLPTRRVARFEGSSTLTTLEARLLAYLAGRPGETVSRQTLLEEVWDYNPEVETRAVDQAVWRLRTKVERDPRQPRHVMTAHGTGYVFEPVREREAATVTPAEVRVGPPQDGESAFVGREDELAWLASAFARGARMVVIAGPGGAGKTRLASELGFRWADRVVTCDLTGASSAGALTEAVARSLDVVLGADGARGAPSQVLARALEGLGPGLVILDNLESVGDAFQTLAAGWLKAAPAARLLVTTRHAQPLRRIRAVEELRLAGLATTSAVALFQSRAQVALARRAAAVDAARAGVAQLVDRVDRLPLAIELAAARVATMSVGEIVRGLGGALGPSHAEPAATRDRTVRGTLAWSWDLLAPHERSALAQLAAFRGGVDREAAEAIVELESGAAPIAEVLEALSQAALVKQRDLGDGIHRYALLESVADFVEERLGAERSAVYERHRRYYCGAGTRAADALRTLARPDAMAWLVREQANLLEAAARARDLLPTDAARLALIVEPVLAQQGPYERHREVLDLAVAAAEESGVSGVLADALLRRSEARRAVGERIAGRADLARVQVLVAGLGDDGLVARALIQEGRFRRHDGTPEEARAAFDAAVGQAAGSGSALVLADARRERGTHLLDQHAFGAAQDEYEAALATYQASGDGAASAWTLTRLATVTLELGDHGAAEATFRAALEAHDAVGDRRGYAVVSSNLAVLEHEVGHLERAEGYWWAATAIHRTLGDARFVGFGLAGQGWIAVERGALEEAVRLLGEALGVFREAGDAFFEAVAETRLGVALSVLGRADDAARAFARARAYLDAGGCGWALDALTLHERLGAVLALTPELRPAAPPPTPTEASFERAARLMWARLAG